MAIDLPPELKSRVGSVIASECAREREAAAEASRARRRIRWVDSERLHFTLKFLGEVEEARASSLIPDVQAAMEAVARDQAPAPIRVRSAGAFPSAARARVLWLDAVDPEGMMARLAAELEGRLEPLGFKRERRPFVPHLTLARLEGRLPAGVLERLQLEDYGEFLPREVVLFESLRHGGPGGRGGYLPLAKAPLLRTPVG